MVLLCQCILLQRREQGMLVFNAAAAAMNLKCWQNSCAGILARRPWTPLEWQQSCCKGPLAGTEGGLR